MSLNHILQKNTENTTENSLDVVFHDIKCNSISFELSDNVYVHVQRSAVQTILPKGTFKSTKKNDKA